MTTNMKLIMENWRRSAVLKEDLNSPTTWGELAQKIMLARAAEKWPRLGKTLLRMGWKVLSSTAKAAMSVVEETEELLDLVPDEWQQKLEKGTDDAAEYLSNFAKEKGGAVGAFIVDDIMGMDDSLSKDLPGFKQLDLEDEYEKILDKEILKNYAKSIIRYAKTANPDDPLPDLNAKLEDELQSQTGAHPDTDAEHVRRTT